MTRILREIIGGKEPTFSARIQQLEQLTGRRTVDIELTAEMLSKLADITRKLNLDPNDTTPEEIYSALIHKAKEHDELLRNSYHENINLVINKLNHHGGVVGVPVIKQSKLRSIIGEVPPKKVMTILGYRSTASLLKRADINQVLLGAFMHESVTWHRAFSKKLKQCTISDITLDEPKIIPVDKKLLKNFNQTLTIPYVQLAGLVGVDINHLNKPYGWLEFTARAADGLFYVHQRGIYLKLNRFQPKIIRQIVDLTYLAPSSITKMASVRVPWSVIYAYVSNNLEEVNFSPDGPVEASDFSWKGSVEVLKNVHQHLDLWKITKIIAKPADLKPVSLNISDIAFNALHGVSYLHRSNSALSRLTLDELLSRYFRHTADKEEQLKNIGI